jgi:hypothetical protein
MNIAFFSACRFLNPLNSAVRSFMPAPNMQSDTTLARHMPLRVARVMELQQSRHHAGRMVISGRMADVCAELDRLAECESRH